MAKNLKYQSKINNTNKIINKSLLPSLHQKTHFNSLNTIYS
jgi:hypothetical protein